MMSARECIVLAFLAAGAMAQAQPNSAAAALTVDGANGPLYPMLVNVRNNTLSTLTVAGAPTMPYAIAQTYGDLVAPPTVAFGYGYFHLPLSPLPNVFADGFSQPLAHSLPASGSRTFPAIVLPPGIFPAGIPVGTMLGFQAIVQDPTSFFGLTLSAATRVTVTAGPTIMNLQLGDEGVAAIALPSGLVLPYYGSNYTSAYVNANGYMTLGTSTTGFSSTPTEFEGGPPRIAGFWTDLDQQSGTIKVTIDSSPPSVAPYLSVEYANVQDWGSFGFPHTFSYVIDATGLVSMTHPTNNFVSIFEVIVGVTQGGSAWPAAVVVSQAKDLSAIQSAGGMHGATSESFSEWYGTTTMPVYFYGVNRPYDLAGRMLTFAPDELNATSVVGQTAKYHFY